MIDIDLLHGEIKADHAVLATWEAQPVGGENIGQEWEYAVDVDHEGIPQRHTGLFTLDSGTDLIKVAAIAMTKAASYL